MGFQVEDTAAIVRGSIEIRFQEPDDGSFTPAEDARITAHAQSLDAEGVVVEARSADHAEILNLLTASQKGAFSEAVTAIRDLAREHMIPQTGE